ncbi:MAG: hypothetical protein FWB71_04905, partial [Defluviitaleaceae bacterium]|nr:hypothetical protein [Defluviitaleaceae bacterium]
RKDNKVNGIYERHDHYYLCDIESETVPQRLTKNEITNEHRFMYVSIDEAIATNELHMRQGFNWTEGIICVLKKLKIL